MKNIFIIAFYFLITGIIFFPRIVHIGSVYGMSDVDTDATLWFYWGQIVEHLRSGNFQSNSLIGYPYGYDLTLIPYKIPFYSFLIWIMTWLGGTIDSIVLVSNIASLITYPITAFITYLLCLKISKGHLASMVGGVVFGFSYYFILMGRGALSLNQIWVIPLFFLGFLNYLERKSTYQLLLTHLISILAFYINPYWCFFNLLLSVPLFLLYPYKKKESKYNLVKSFLVFYGSFITLFIVTNIEYIYTNLAVLSSRAAGLKVGRDLGVTSYLLNPASYFAFARDSVFSMTGLGDNPLGYTSLLIAIIGLIKHRNVQVMRVFMICILITILISSNIPLLHPINELYFKYFNIFRAVSRLNLYASLFLAILVSVTLDQFSRSYVGIRRFYCLISIIIIVMILCESQTKDPSWQQMTNIQSMRKTYERIRNDESIKSVVVYPQQLSNGTYGVPAPHMLMGQIIHGKQLVNGVDPFNEEQIRFYNKTAMLVSPPTIGYLEKSGVDTILIHDKLTNNFKEIKRRLSSDKRLQYYGAFVGDPDTDNLGNEMITANEKSRSIVVYRIRANLGKTDSINDTNLTMINGEEAQHTNSTDSFAYIPLLHPDRWIVYEGSRAGWISQIIFGSKYVNPIIQNRVATTIIKKNNTKHLQFIAIKNKTYHIIFKQSLVRHASDLSRDTTLIIMLFACGSLYLLRKEKKRQDDSLNISRDN